MRRTSGSVWPWYQVMRALIAAGAGLFGLQAAAQTPPWMNASLLPTERACLLLQQMTFNEKITLLHGTSGSYVGNVAGIPRLGIPEWHLSDGPAGVGLSGVTALPAPLALAASFDTELARQYGQVIGEEARGKGVHVMLGPMVNMVRVSQSGRAFETFGEDPYLSAAITAGHIRGIQSQRAIALAKHFVCNDQETTRGNLNAHVDERTLHEIYYPPFLAAVRAGVGALCSAYNRINDSWCSESPSLGAITKAMWGFDGFVVCDWNANFSAEGAANNGLDMEQALPLRFGTTLVDAVNAGTVAPTQVDEMVLRILTIMFRFGNFDDPPPGNVSATVTTPAHAQVARQVAAQGMVLLKNTSGVLPLSTDLVRSIAVIGSPGYANLILTGTGSGQCYPPYYNSPLEAITARAGAGATVTYTRGDGGQIAEAVQAASQADVAVVCVGEQTGEGTDRLSLALPGDQDSLVASVAAANPRTIVVLYSGAATLMPWVSQVPAVVVAWFPGQEGGNALASVLFGDVNPSGRLPVTFPVTGSQVPASTPAQYPGTNLQVQYSEGMLMGYRWYDASSVTPLFPFGHGLSYTRFTYEQLSIGPLSGSGQVQIGLKVSNAGPRSGSEVAQLYLGFPAGSGEPPKILKGFQKVFLQPGETKNVQFPLVWEDLAFWDVSTHSWKVPLGEFHVMAGASSRDIRLTGQFTVAQAIPPSALANRALYRAAGAEPASQGPPRLAVDGDTATAWHFATAAPTDLTLDLGTRTAFNRLRIYWGESYASGYLVRVSDDNLNWTSAFVTGQGSGGIEDRIVSATGRYVQLRITQCGSQGCFVREFEMYPPETRIFPTLSARTTAAAGVVVSWPRTSGFPFLRANAWLNWAGYNLYESPGLAPANWASANVSLVAINGTNQASAPLIAPRLFYQLRLP